MCFAKKNLTSSDASNVNSNRVAIKKLKFVAVATSFIICGLYTNGVTADDHIAAAESVKDLWLTEVQHSVARREYFVSTHNDDVQAPNRAQNFRSYFTSQGMAIQSRNATDKKMLFAIEYAGISRGKNPQQNKQSSVSYTSNKVTLQHEWGVQEGFVNADSGISHGFVLQKRLPGTEPLRLVLDVAVGRVSMLDNRLQVSLLDGRKVSYQYSTFTDANGVQGDVQVSQFNQQIQLEIDDQQVVYPLTIEPVVIHSSLQYLSQLPADTGLDIVLSNAGDVNGDEYQDYLLGSRYFDDGAIDSGAAFIIFGKKQGGDSSSITRLPGAQSGSQFGAGVSTAGDVNQDGYMDVIIGAPYFDGGSGENGAAFIYLGSASGINPSSPITLLSNQTKSLFGYSVANAGDVNNDGFADIVVGAFMADTQNTRTGAAFVYHGNTMGIDKKPQSILEGQQSGSEFGFNVAGAGDVNGDGFDDVVIGAYLFDQGKGAAFVYQGSQTGIRSKTSRQLTSSAHNAEFAFNATQAGDINNDGFGDILVSASVFKNGQTQQTAFIYHGSSKGISRLPGGSLNHEDSRQLLTGNFDFSPMLTE